MGRTHTNSGGLQVCCRLHTEWLSGRARAATSSSFTSTNARVFATKDVLDRVSLSIAIDKQTTLCTVQERMLILMLKISLSDHHRSPALLLS